MKLVRMTHLWEDCFASSVVLNMRGEAVATMLLAYLFLASESNYIPTTSHIYLSYAMA